MGMSLSVGPQRAASLPAPTSLRLAGTGLPKNDWLSVRQGTPLDVCAGHASISIQIPTPVGASGTLLFTMTIMVPWPSPHGFPANSEVACSLLALSQSITEEHSFGTPGSCCT